MIHEEVAKYRELSGDANPNTPISRIGGYLDGYEKALAEQPTVKAVPIEVLQEIRAELTKYYVDPYNRNAFRYTTVSLLDVLDLIDKHIKEYTV